MNAQNEQENKSVSQATLKDKPKIKSDNSTSQQSNRADT